MKENEFKKIEIAKGKSYDYGVYYARHSANHLLEEINKGEKDFLKPNLIHTLSSIVEGKLNACFIDFCFDKFGDSYKSYSKTFLKMSIHDKLNILIPLISNYKLQLNYEKTEIKRIRKIIEYRNQLIHIKQHYTTNLYEEAEDYGTYEYNLNEKELGIYHDIKYAKLETEFLNESHKLIHQFNLKFENLSRNINYKKFKTEDWFIPIDNRKNKITINSDRKTNEIVAIKTTAKKDYN